MVTRRSSARRSRIEGDEIAALAIGEALDSRTPRQGRRDARIDNSPRLCSKTMGRRDLRPDAHRSPEGPDMAVLASGPGRFSERKPFTDRLVVLLKLHFQSVLIDLSVIFPGNLNCFSRRSRRISSGDWEGYMTRSPISSQLTVGHNQSLIAVNDLSDYYCSRFF
jgi:hypothetical protein